MRSTCTAARTVRAISGVKTRPMMMVIAVTDGPMATTNRNAMITKGSARMASTIRATTRSKAPPR